MTIAMPIHRTFRREPGSEVDADTPWASRAESAVRDHIETLGSHVLACAKARGRYFSLQCLFERIDTVVAPRFCTTVLLACVLIGVGSVWG